MSSIPAVGTSAYKAYLRSTGQSQAVSSGSIFNSLLLNNANHFGSFGSDLPSPVLEQVVASEHKSDPFGAKAEVQRVAESYQEEIQNNKNNINPSPLPYPHSSVGLTPSKIAELEFINADLAKYYGMSKETAYQEALANTAYQRAVKDMRDAGLNPAVIYGAGRGSTANSSIYGQSASSGGGGGYYRSGGKGSNGKLFSSSAYGAIASAVGLATAIGTKNPGNYWVGNSIAQGAMNLANAVSNWR